MGYRIDPQTGRGYMAPNEPVDPRAPAAVRSASDPFARHRAELRDIGRARMEVGQPLPEPSDRSALVGNGERGEELNAAALAVFDMGELPGVDRETFDAIRERITADGAKLRDSAEVPAALANAYAANEFVDDVDDAADELADEREENAAFTRFVNDVIADGDEARANELLDGLAPDDYDAVMADLQDAFYAESDDGDDGDDDGDDDDDDAASVDAGGGFGDDT